MEAIELGFDTLVRLCILLIELAGIIVIVISMVRGFIGFVQRMTARVSSLRRASCWAWNSRWAARCCAP